ncbi:hypothetical protein BDF22DRAFT_679087 [Syncephalis plumigaleata]|nr:hypothetical protein BDF22DRAFT_679087 [Syncephalis plumigaleata]
MEWIRLQKVRVKVTGTISHSSYQFALLVCLLLVQCDHTRPPTHPHAYTHTHKQIHGHTWEHVRSYVHTNIHIHACC